MTVTRRFLNHAPAHRAACLALFDANCPQFFARNERADYEQFLDTVGPGYQVCFVADDLVGAFGLLPAEAGDRRHLNWIMLAPSAQGAGHGRAIMAEVAAKAHATGVTLVHIAASHLSAPFFARFGAIETNRTQDGWGPAMHRVDMEWRPART